MKEPTVASREAPLGHSIKSCPIRTPLPLPPQTRSVHAIILFFLFCLYNSQPSANKSVVVSSLSVAPHSSRRYRKRLVGSETSKNKKTQPSLGYADIILRS